MFKRRAAVILWLLAVIFAVGVMVLTDADVTAQSGAAVARFWAKLILLAGIGFPASFLVLSRFLSPQAARNFTMAILVLAGSIVLSISVAEVYVRYTYRDITTTGHSSFFSIKWHSANPPSINRFGFRERDYADKQNDDVFRIAVIGDSFTYGQGVDTKDRLSDILESSLNKGNGGKFEVLNFGKRGTETVDHLNFLKDYVLASSPDFILLQWFINDVEVDKSERPKPFPLVPSYVFASYLNQHSGLYFLLDSQWRILQQRLGMAGSYEDYMVERFVDLDDADLLQADQALEEIFAVAQRNSIPTAILMFPALSGEIQSKLGFLIDHVATICERNGVVCIDLRRTLATAESASDLWVNRFDNHPNRLANELAAIQVLERFETQWRVEVGNRATD